MEDRFINISLPVIGALIALWSFGFQIFFHFSEKTKDKAPDERGLSYIIRAFRVSSDKIFGDRLVSTRSIFISIMLTFGYFFLFIYIAETTSPISVNVTIQRIFDQFFNNEKNILFLCIFLVGIILTDYISIIETRYVIKRMAHLKSLRLIWLIIFLDFAASLLIFVILYPVPPTIIGHFFSDEPGPCGEGHGFRYDFFTMYTNAFGLAIEMIFFHFEKIFTPFVTLRIPLSADSSCITHQILQNEYHAAHVLDHLMVSEGYFVYPFTTLWATTHVTSIWLYLYLIAPLIAKIIVFERRLGVSIEEKLKNNPRIIIYFCIVISVVIIL